MCLSLAMGLSIPLEPGIPKIYGLPPRSYITKIQNIGGRESEREGERECEREFAHEHFLLSRGTWRPHLNNGRGATCCLLTETEYMSPMSTLVDRAGRGGVRRTWDPPRQEAYVHAQRANGNECNRVDWKVGREVAGKRSLGSFFV